MELSRNDKILFESLFYDARLSTRELAKIVGIKQPSVYARIKKLEQEGFISRYDSLINTHALPFIYKMYYVSLNEEQIKNIVRMEICLAFSDFSESFRIRLLLLQE